MTIGPELSGTPDREGAARWIQAHIIETLSATGHETIDFYFLKVTRALEEYQIDGALSALEELKQEGNIRFVGLFADGPALAALGLWQFHDAFEAVLLSNNPVERETYQTLAPMAAERRTGILGLRPLNWGFGAPFSVLQPDWTLNGITAAQAAIHFYSQRHPVLVGVRTPEEVVAALAAPSLAPPEGIGSLLEVYAAHYRDPESWAALVGDQRPWVRQAALKAMNSGTRGAPVNVD
jgi:aryl-alcohol dehydrogenase-like predicted oxidoreductase